MPTLVEEETPTLLLTETVEATSAIEELQYLEAEAIL
jgi:hypothetical protein